MNLLFYYKIVYIITAFSSFIFALIILRKNNKAKFNILYALVNFSVIVWAIGRYASLIVDSHALALFWVRVLYIGSILIYIFFLHTILILLKIDQKRKIVLIIFYLNATLLSLVNIFDLVTGSNFFVLDVVPKIFFPFYETPGHFYILQLIANTFIPIYAVVEMIFAYRSSQGLKRGQIRYILISSLFGMAGGGTILFLVYNIPIQPFGLPLVLIQFLTMTYAITRYRLMDIRLVIVRSIIFGFFVFLITAIYAILSAIIATFFESIVGFTSNITVGIIVAILIVIGYGPLRKLIERSTNRFLYKKTYDPDELLAQISAVTSSILDLKNLLTSIGMTLDEAFHTQRIGVALLNKKKELAVVYKNNFEEGVAESLVGFPGAVAALYKEIKQVGGMLVIDEIKTRFENGEFKPANSRLLLEIHKSDVALVIPLYVKEQLIGIVALGNKKSGDPYNHQDLRTLNIIASQAAIAIENARLYEELKDFSGKLEVQVKAKTMELRKANDELKQLDQAKSEFISIASHQLRTPLTVIKGYISMMREGSFGEISPVVMNNLEKVYISNERLIGLVENLLDISRIESGKQKFDWQKTQLEDLAATIVDNLKKNAKDKGLKLLFHKPNKKLPIILADPNKLHEVMMNFIDNSIKYTEKGEINVRLVAEPKGMITFCVQDHGRGVDPKVMPLLFRKFSRGKDSFRVHTEGVGLGLYVAKMVIDSHYGKIWAESEGRNKGSKFCFSIPIKNSKIEQEAKQKPKEEIKK